MSDLYDLYSHMEIYNTNKNIQPSLASKNKYVISENV